MSLPAWTQQHVKSIHDVDYFYRTKPGRLLRKRVLLEQITGTLYTEYAERLEAGVVRKQTWLDMQLNLQRARPAARARYLSYYDRDKQHAGLGLRQYGQEYLISEGNNRLCTWKFAQKDSIVADVQEYVFDTELHAAWHLFTAQHIAVTRLPEDLFAPPAIWALQVGDLAVQYPGRRHVLAFARFYEALGESGRPAWWRLTSQRHPPLQEGSDTLIWRAEKTENIPWFNREFRPYLLAYKLRQLQSRKLARQARA